MLQEALGERRSDFSYALGGWSGQIKRGKGKEVDRSKAKWKPDISATKAVIQFVKATQRLQPWLTTRSEEE